ncbi:tyrosine-protein phosphatase non-receptor type 9-like [Bacillus rossius redtenbacheri]|uniref:tyrosine-protein phosphatase non-receptor type 9-like n=1 Tax=Bacillus rossius redtenbacheri TaxID=93214 RepID=UPI002FDE0786
MATTFEALKHAEFMALMESSDCEKVIYTEHQEIISRKLEGTFEADKANQSLKRYAASVCFDHSRVVLPTEKERGNFINANYISGFKQTKRFICGEAPTRRTCYDFYRMLWMEHAQIIVMLCQKKENGKEKCYPYWSEKEESSMMVGKFKITTTSVERFPHYVKSVLSLTDGTTATQTVIHYNFTAWPDHDVPTNTSEFLNFVLEVRQCQKELYAESLKMGHQLPQPFPIVVHCHAGLGRTPCFCVVDISISRFNEEKTVSIASTVCDIRQGRFHTLFNPFQYLFCYRAVKLYIESIPVEAVRKTSTIQQAVSFLRNLGNLVNK